MKKIYSYTCQIEYLLSVKIQSIFVSIKKIVREIACEKYHRLPLGEEFSSLPKFVLYEPIFNKIHPKVLYPVRQYTPSCVRKLIY